MSLVTVKSPAELADPGKVSQFCIQAIESVRSVYQQDYQVYVGEPQLFQLAEPIGPNTAAQLEYRYTGEARRLGFQVAALEASATSCWRPFDVSPFAPYSASSAAFLTIGEPGAP